MAQSLERQHEAGPLQSMTAPQQQSSPAKANPFKNFTVGDWSPSIWSDELWDDDSELYSSTPPVPTLTSASPTVMSEDDDEYSLALEQEEIDIEHELEEDMRWLMLKHKEAEKLNGDLDGFSYYSPSEESAEDPSDSDTTGTESVSDSDDSDEKAREQGVLYARLLLCQRAIEPPRSPRRETFVVQPSKLRTMSRSSD